MRGGFRGQRGFRGQGQALPLLLLLLTGCGDDRPYSGPPPGAPRQARTRPAAPPVIAAPTAPAAGQMDPLVGDMRPNAPDPLVGQDPLQGRAIPTAHSHWLRGRLRDARVTVLLNGVQHGSYSGLIDQDITMKLRRGANTVTFVYQPTAPGAAADLEVVESEHHPDIAPLVTFHGGAGGMQSGDEPKAVTQTFPFVAE